MSGKKYVERDLALIKVDTPPERRPEIVSLVEVFRGRVVDMSARDIVIEVKVAVRLPIPVGVDGIISDFPDRVLTLLNRSAP